MTTQTLELQAVTDEELQAAAGGLGFLAGIGARIAGAFTRETVKKAAVNAGGGLGMAALAAGPSLTVNGTRMGAEAVMAANAQGAA